MKDKIIQKAADMFLSHGFKSVTMDQVSEGMGISKKTLYGYFATKSELVAGTLDYLYNIISGGIDEICALGKDPIDEMYEIKKFMMSRLKGEKASPIFQLQRYYPEMFQKVKEKQYAKMQECTVENLRRGIEKGVYRKNINVEFVWRIYFLGINGIKDESVFPRPEFSQKEVHEEFLSYHLRGIVTRKGLDKLNKIINGNP